MSATKISSVKVTTSTVKVMSYLCSHSKVQFSTNCGLSVVVFLHSAVADITYLNNFSNNIVAGCKAVI